MSSSTQITRENLIERLQKALPDFSINPDWQDEHLGYPIVNDLARFICNRAGMEEFEQVRTGIGFLEMGLEGGDEYVRDLVAKPWRHWPRASIFRQFRRTSGRDYLISGSISGIK